MNPSSTVIYIYTCLTNSAKCGRIKSKRALTRCNARNEEGYMKKRAILRGICLLLVAVMMLFAVGCDMSEIFGDIEVEGNGRYEDLSELYNNAAEKLTEDNSHNKNNNHGSGDKNETDRNHQNNQNNGQNNNSNKPPQYDGKTDMYGDPAFESAVPTDELDFGGKEIAVLYRDYIHNSREWYKEYPEDELDEAIAMRNEAVEETLGVKILWEPIASNGNDYTEYTARFHAMVMSDVTSGTHYYDISANFGYPTVAPSIRDYAANLLDMDEFPYFDFSLPCWNQSIVENTTVNNRFYYVAGALNLSMFDAACVIWQNKTMYDQWKEPTDPDNLQALALEGKWTYDELYRWTSVFYKNTNMAMPGRDIDDQYALIANYNASAVVIDAIPYAWDLDFVVTNHNGTHSFDISGNEKAETALQRYRNILHGVGTSTEGGVYRFAQGKAIFYMDRLYSDYNSNMAIREMEDKYALLPLPKYDQYQKEYATTAADYFTLMFVLDHFESDIPTHGEEVSAFLQYATEMSYTGVRGYYLHRIIKPKFFGYDDSEGTVSRSAALLDTVVNNIEFSFASIYSPRLNNISHLWRQACQGTDTFEAMYMRNRDDFDRAIYDTDCWFGLERKQ